MRLFVIAFILILGSDASDIEKKSYAGHQLWRLTLRTHDQLTRMIDLRRLAHQHDINFWSEELRLNTPVRYSTDVTRILRT